MLVILLALVAAGIAAAKPQRAVESQVGELELSLNGGLRPERISKTKPTPVSLSVSGEVRMVDGRRPRPLREFVLQGDRNVAVDVKGLPTCTAGKLRSRDTAQAEAICGPAILGTGELTVDVEFPETLIPASSKVVAFNGGVSGGTSTIFIHAYLELPRPAAIVGTVKVKGVRDGPVEAVASIPPIVEQFASIKAFDLTIRKRAVVSAICADGKINARGVAVFAFNRGSSSGVTRVPWKATRACAQVGS